MKEVEPWKSFAESLPFYEQAMLAALSWVWDAQERAHAEAVQPFYAYLEAQHTKTFDALMKRMQRAMTRGTMRRLSAERA